jgi:alkylresorcinol/alkylpyrone synthase
MQAALHGLAVALPPHRLHQPEVAARAREVFGDRYPQFERLARSYAAAGIDERRSVVPMDWFERDHGWTDRAEAFVTGAVALFETAARGALDEAGWPADTVDVIVTVCTTGIATPTLEARALHPMGFRDDVQRVPIFGLGCAGGVSGLTVAADLARARPGDRILLVVVETCSLSFRADRLQKADIIASALFGDGAASACLSTDAAPGRTAVRFGTGHQKTWPDTLGIMGWDVDEIGFGVVFDRSIPGFVREEFAGATDGALRAANLRLDQIDRFVCHPGGAKVVDAIEAALHLPQGSLDAERETLRRAGNMSAPTVLFVLRAVLDGGAGGQMMACALGPGFTASFLPFTVAPEPVARAA